jgi:hypothetical protein
MSKAKPDEALERAAFEAWAKVWWPNSHPPDAAWVGWQARSIRTPANSLGQYYAPDGTFMNADGTRSIFDDVDM